MLESEMYQPIKNYLIDLGYTVKAEVRNVDVMAVKGEKVIVIEMKKQLSMKHIYQGCNRQKMFDNVYLSVFHPGIKKIHSKSFKEKLHILHRLCLGLMVVDIENSKVEVLLDPKIYVVKKNRKKQQLLLDEFNNRKKTNNIGGVHRKKIMTAYREQTIEIAKVLIAGPKTTKEIRNITKNPKSTRILYDNYYGWFYKLERGLYELSVKGKFDLIDYLG